MKTAISMFALAAITVSTWAISEKGLVLYLPFEEGQGDTTQDLSPSGLTAMIGGAAWSNDGKLGPCALFETAGAFVEAPAAPELDLTEALTIALWINPVQSQPDSGILGRRNAGNTGGYAMQWSAQFTGSPQIETWLYTAAWNGTRQKQSISPNLDEWHYIASVFDGSMLRQYINMELDTEMPVAAPLNSVPETLRIGGGSTGISPMMGRMDELTIYNRALTAAELEFNMNNSGLDVSAKGRLATTWSAIKRR
ncbi:MAG: LamG domain-containing protein [Candidatus Poribacteria bacterium]|nr:LamG domain-containing protein [Candidatus Poribacteria bacterium]